MENASEALKIAGAVLLFVMALSIIIFSFTNVRQASDTILDYRDRETEYITGQDVTGNYYYDTEKNARVVRLETVIPSIYRAYLENYKIVFVGISPIYKISRVGENDKPKYTIDTETNASKVYRNAVVGNNNEKKAFIKGILYHDYSGMTLLPDPANPGSFYPNNEKSFEKNFYIKINGCIPLFDQLKRQKDNRIFRGLLSG